MIQDLPPKAWGRVSKLLDEALELTAEERPSFLDRACAGEPELRAQVERLLGAGDNLGSFINSTRGGPAAALLREMLDKDKRLGEEDRATSAPTETVPPSSHPQEVIGPYHLLQKIGEGGMGEVWLAEQSAPVRRKVALKLIKAGMDSREVIARFEAERQALALMDHPAIAKVFEAGETPRGLPYFAMEYVRGEPITAYCDRQRLTTTERLRLFQEVCAGVQHAHQKGIIHRDLKPSNVLVTIQGEKPVPKIIDFGVAKATAQKLTERTMYTELGVLIGTPGYMSPEQAEMTGLDIDTRTDVYALGVILYELLTGALPFDPKELRAAGFDEIRRRIREVVPPRPSTKVSTLGERAKESAERRHTEPGKLVSRLKGDPDWITMKALEKDRTRRYGSPSELAADIERHLTDQPVLARAPGTMYQLRLFTRRHRALCAAAATVFVVLLGASIVSTVMYLRAHAARTEASGQRDAALAVTRYLTTMLASANPSEARGRDITVREVLDKAASAIDASLGGQKEAEASVRLALGETYESLGVLDRAEQQLLAAESLRRHLYGDDHPDTLETLSALSGVRWRQGKFDEAERLQRQVLETRRRVLGPQHPDTLRSLNSLGMILRDAGKNVEGVRLFRESADLRRRALGPDDPGTLSAQYHLATLLEKLGFLAEAKRLHRETLDARIRALGEDHPDTMWSMVLLGFTFNHAGEHDEAEPIVRRACELETRVLGKDHPDTLWCRNVLGEIWRAQGKTADARSLFEEILEVRRRVLGDEHRDTLWTMTNLGLVRMDLGLYPEAEAVARPTLDVRLRLLGENHWDTVWSRRVLALILESEGRLGEAERLLRRNLSVFESALPGQEWPYLSLLDGLTGTLRKQGNFADAESVLLGADRRFAVELDVPPGVREKLHESIIRFYDAWATAQPGQGHDLQAAEWRGRLQPPSEKE